MNDRLDPKRNEAASSATDASIVPQMAKTFAAQRAAFAGDMSPGRDVRRERLARVLALTEKHQRAIAEAISADFGHRSRHETDLAEIFVVLSGVRHMRRHVGRWMKPRRVATPLHMQPARSEVIPQPLGVVGVISPWNYPYQLGMVPAAAALAAGNRVMLKPSELTPTFAALLRQIVAEYFAAEEFAVVPGDVEVGRAFSKLPFDHLLFTGSTAVGRQVALAAAENLTPVTLELGGKSPAIIDAGGDIAVAAARIAFGKLMNAGQTCIAPDYALVPRARVDDFVAAFQKTVRAMYPSLAGNPDYTSIVSDRHYERLTRLVDDAKAQGATVIRIAPRGEAPDASDRRMPPTLLVGVDDDMAVMREEIFGPVLPILAYDTEDEAIGYVNRHPRPLALYWFGNDNARRDRVLHKTIAGGVTVNDTVWHFAQENLPFGGVGASGYGAYHGEQGFLTFSKRKPVFHQAALNAFGRFRPPFGRQFEALVALLKRYF